jgi:hypothetical protein
MVFGMFIRIGKVMKMKNPSSVRRASVFCVGMIKRGSDLSASPRGEMELAPFPPGGEVVKASAGHNPQPFWISIPKNCCKIRKATVKHQIIF